MSLIDTLGPCNSYIISTHRCPTVQAMQATTPKQSLRVRKQSHCKQLEENQVINSSPKLLRSPTSRPLTATQCPAVVWRQQHEGFAGPFFTAMAGQPKQASTATTRRPQRLNSFTASPPLTVCREQPSSAHGPTSQTHRPQCFWRPRR